MMKYYIIILVTILLGSCKNANEAEIKTAPSQTSRGTSQEKGDLNETDTAEKVSFANAAFDGVYADYLALKAALVNTDKEVAHEAARDLAKSAAKGSFANVQAQTLRVVSAESIAAQREVFETVSAAVETELLKQEITSGKVFKQYCPMAFNGKGAYWLSNSKEVRNPYFGDQMLTCGVVDKEIK